MARLGDICIINPKVPTFNNELTVSFVPMQKVGENGEFDPSEIREYQDVKKGFTYFQNGDVLFAKITPCMENGKGAVARNLEHGIGFGSTEFHVLRPLTEYVTSEWIFYLLSWETFRKEAEKNMTGSAGQKRVPKSFLEGYSINIPDLNVQRNMTEALTKISDVISLRKQQLEKLDELVKSRFIELFGDPLDNTKGLPIDPFANCCLDMHQGINTVADKVEYQPYGYPIIQSKNITKGFLDLDDVRYLTNEDYEKYRGKYNPKVNDILICNIGTIGKSLVIKDEKNFLIAWNLFLVKLNLEKVNPDYIKVFVEFLNDRHYYDQFLTGGTVKFVNKKTMGNIPVLMPSIEQQTQFADFLKQTDKSKLAIQQSLDKLETLKKALMQKYFG